VLIMAFMMIEATRYPAKLRLAAASAKATERLDRFGKGLRDYVVINTVFGLVAGGLNTVLLLALGVDFAILWGVASFALSFLPNIGFLMALVPPALLALIQFGFGRAAAVVAGFVAINFIVDNVIKPRFVGESLDLSPVVVLLSLIFWGWMLGVSGALLAVPLTMSARFLFESFDGTRGLGRLMSDADPGAGAGPRSPR
jgi:predicted PurR-regulated permease PerM